jgi:hypothetical protein
MIGSKSRKGKELTNVQGTEEGQRMAMYFHAVVSNLMPCLSALKRVLNPVQI